MKNLILISLILLSIELSAQINCQIQSNDFKSDIFSFIETKKAFQKYDCILIKYEDCYWFKRVNYRLVGYEKNRVSLISIYKKKKNDKFTLWNTKVFDNSDLNSLIDSLSLIGLFSLKDIDLNSVVVLSDGLEKRHFISDGVSEYFAFYHHGTTWGLAIYEPKEFHNFSMNKNFLIILKSIDLFNQNWKNLN